ncbi:helix-turn-helix domain-containing protein [Clostridiisalibacter paucivorans]|uniref:helix-turn-helix domain-containing protein n=1 Tax=Clostridiisalibacter paucivorans TaxID=408753 RepID=UPI00047C5944|nr:helix-turn-helix domain-containing protein [Clostridiisalibacter paucivorans]
MLNGNLFVPKHIAEKLNIKENIMYAVLRNFMNNQNKTCYPSIATLSDTTGWCPNTVRKWLRKLEEKGVILIKKRIIKKQGKKWNDTNIYHFILEGVVQNNNNSTSKNRDKLNKKEKNKNMTVQTIKDKLLKKYDNSIVQKALQCLKRATEHGTVINHLLNYLNAICTKILKQMELIKGIDSLEVGKHDIKKGKSPSANNTRAKVKTKFHNFEQRTSKYSAKELEDMVRYKFK